MDDTIRAGVTRMPLNDCQIFGLALHDIITSYQIGIRETLGNSDAVLPVTLSPDRIPEGVSVSFDSERKPVSNDFPADFTVMLRASHETLPGIYFTVITVSGPGFSTSAHFDLEIKPSAN